MEPDGRTIRAPVGEVADRLPPEDPQHLVVLAGGSLLAWHGLRESTRDVDSLRPLDLELARAADAVGAALWPLAGFGSPQQAAEQFWNAYPHAADDPDLGDFIAGIAEAAGPEGGPQGLQQQGPAR